MKHTNHKANALYNFSGLLKRGFKRNGNKAAVVNEQITAERDYHTPGTAPTAVYYESGWKAEVEILENNSDAAKYSYKLKVIKTYADGIFGRLPDGQIFTAFADKNYMAYCDWRFA